MQIVINDKVIKWSGLILQYLTEYQAFFEDH